MKQGKKDAFDPILVASAFYPRPNCDELPVVGSNVNFMNFAITHRRTILADQSWVSPPNYE